MDLSNYVTVMPIIIICYVFGIFFKNLKNFPDSMIPVVISVIGAIIAVPAMYVMTDFPANDIITAISVGIASGLASVGANQIYKQVKKEEL